MIRSSTLPVLLLMATVLVAPSGGTSWSRDPDWLVDTTDKSSQLLTRHPRFLVFNNAGIIKLILSFVIPVELRRRSLVWTTNLQYQYSTPVNYTQLFPVTYTMRSGDGARSVRAIDRTTIYEVIRLMLERKGIDGRACILRAICEVADTPIAHNGLVGEIMHILFTPDTSKSIRSRWRRHTPRWNSEDSLSEDFFMAQLEGEAQRRKTSRRLRRTAAAAEGATSVADVCHDGFPSCPSSILDMVSILMEM